MLSHTQLFVTLCRLPDSSVHGIFQARILKTVAISFSRGTFSTQRSSSCLLHLLHWQADSLPLAPTGKLNLHFTFVKSEQPLSLCPLSISFSLIYIYCFSHVQIFAALWTVQPARLSLFMGFSKHSSILHTGLGCHALLQGIFLT